jgi:Na+/H+-dicarboxylate symporter
MSDAALITTQDRQSPANLFLRFARAISWIGHPLVFISLAVGVVVALRLANRVGLVVLLTLLVCVVLPMALLLFRGVRSGRWSDADVSVRTERTRFYPRAIPISAIGVIALWLLRAPGFALRGAFVTLALLVVAALLNFRIKLSLHALFAFYSSVILFRVATIAGAIALALALLVFWSRLYLQRHDLPEMLTGTLLGVVGGIATAWWL